MMQAALSTHITKLLWLYFPWQRIMTLPVHSLIIFKKMETYMRVLAQKSEGKEHVLRVVRHWNRLPRDAVDAPSLAVFKARSDGALSNLV